VSYPAQTWVNLHAPYGAGAVRAVLKELANATNEDSGMAWPGLERLSLDTGYSRRAVWDALQTLVRDGVIVTIETGRGRGIRSRFQIVMDASKWTLSAEAIASGMDRTRRRRAFEERKKKGAYAAPFRPSKKVQSLHRLRSEKVQSATEKGAICDANQLSHPLYESKDNQRAEVVESKGSQRDAATDAKFAALFKDLVAKMDRRARGGL
jgi:biotin operon repressor